MEADEIIGILRRQPFEPVRVHLSDGTVFEVWHPDQVMVSKRSSHVGVGGNGDRAFQRIVVVSNIHITHIEPVGG